MLEDSLNKLSGALALAERWVEEGAGTTTQADIYALQTGMALVKRYIAEYEGLREIALAGLKLLLELGPEDTLTLSDNRLKPVDLPPQDLSELQQIALGLRPEMKQVEAGLKARRALVAANNSEKYPNVYAGIGGSVAYSPERVETEDIAVYDPFNHAGLTPVLGVKWDWYSGSQAAKVKQAKAELDALVEKKSFALKGIPFQVTEQYHTVQSQHVMLQELYQAARSARRWMIASYADFEAGVEDPKDTIDALQAYILAYGEYLQIANEFNLSVARLRVVTGEKP
jgi:outer membrane protein TolC